MTAQAAAAVRAAVAAAVINCWKITLKIGCHFFSILIILFKKIKTQKRR